MRRRAILGTSLVLATLGILVLARPVYAARLASARAQYGAARVDRRCATHDGWPYHFAERRHDRHDWVSRDVAPEQQLEPFLRRIRPVLARSPADLLNVTIRNVFPDSDSFLAYARQPVWGLVMLFTQDRTPEAETAMRDFTRQLIDAALAVGGTYYLPYRLHATPEQFLRAYPMAPRVLRVTTEVRSARHFLQRLPSGVRCALSGLSVLSPAHAEGEQPQIDRDGERRDRTRPTKIVASGFSVARVDRTGAVQCNMRRTGAPTLRIGPLDGKRHSRAGAKEIIGGARLKNRLGSESSVVGEIRFLR